jgi:amino acid transporter
MVFKTGEFSYWAEGSFSCFVSTSSTIRHIVINCLFSLIFTGALVLGGFTRIRDPFANFQSPFSGSTTNPNSLATGLVKINWTFYGWQNAFSVLGEVRTPDPVRTVRKAGFLSLLLSTCLFFFVNVAYVAAVPKDEISSSGQLIGALFFQHVFGKSFTAQMLPVMVALTCFGSMVCDLCIPLACFTGCISRLPG